MPKDNLQLISVRISHDTLTKIERVCAKHTYWKRNAVINSLLTTIMNDFDDNMIYDMIRRPFFQNNEIIADYEIGQNIVYKPDTKQ